MMHIGVIIERVTARTRQLVAQRPTTTPRARNRSGSRAARRRVRWRNPDFSERITRDHRDRCTTPHRPSNRDGSGIDTDLQVVVVQLRRPRSDGRGTDSRSAASNRRYDIVSDRLYASVMFPQLKFALAWRHLRSCRVNARHPMFALMDATAALLNCRSRTHHFSLRYRSLRSSLRSRGDAVGQCGGSRCSNHRQVLTRMRLGRCTDRSYCYRAGLMGRRKAAQLRLRSSDPDCHVQFEKAYYSAMLAAWSTTSTCGCVPPPRPPSQLFHHHRTRRHPSATPSAPGSRCTIDEATCPRPRGDRIPTHRRDPLVVPAPERRLSARAACHALASSG